MGTQPLTNPETTDPQEVQTGELINSAGQVRYGDQLTTKNVIVIRVLVIFFCLAFWYGVFKLVSYVFLSG
jgi:hypothetical protein